ncbi:hypothetical protein [Leptolyngbya sp. 7M]|uniref:hypothetical protein n=1 Tax=Leptolyngbya sp. 7M TaxID=2812896 RepID=UPI001B8C3121|nr:hypothetical protein [Leptolyngbya sp. 7M]QYO68891.1 hypothetical protein JVX88_20055 [Leptolyngbya sp. 7M]
MFSSALDRSARILRRGADTSASCWADAHPTGEAAQIEDAKAHAIDARTGRAG